MTGKHSLIVRLTELDKNTILDLDANGKICALTLEHAKERTNLQKFSFEQITL